MTHRLREGWSMNGCKSGTLHIDDFKELANSEEDAIKINIDFSEVCHKPLPKYINQRYIEADTSIPPTIIESENICGKKYKMIDGRHRLKKMIDEGKTHSDFNLITNLDKLYSYINCNEYNILK